MKFGEWYEEAHGVKFSPTFPMNDAEYEFEYIQYCKHVGIDPDFEGRYPKMLTVEGKVESFVRELWMRNEVTSITGVGNDHNIEDMLDVFEGKRIRVTVELLEDNTNTQEEL